MVLSVVTANADDSFDLRTADINCYKENEFSENMFVLVNASLTTKIRKVRIGVVAIRLHNPVTNQSTCVYAFQDGGSQLTLLRKSIAEEIGLHGTPRLQKCCGMHTTADVLMESMDLNICGIEEPETFNIKKVNVTEIVPEMPHSLPSALNLNDHENFKDLP